MPEQVSSYWEAQGRRESKDEMQGEDSDMVGMGGSLPPRSWAIPRAESNAKECPLLCLLPWNGPKSKGEGNFHSKLQTHTNLSTPPHLWNATGKKTA